MSKALFLLLYVLFVSQLFTKIHCQEQDHQYKPDGKAQVVKPNSILYIQTFYYKYFFIFGSVLIACIIRYLVKCYEIPVPYAVFVVLYGVMWGLGTFESEWMKNMSGVSSLMERFRPVYLPILLFTISFCIDGHSFWRAFYHIIIIAIPVTALNAMLMGLLMRLIINASDWSNRDGLLFGFIISGTYPMEVTRWLKGTNIQEKYVTVFLEGESLISIVLAVFMYEILVLNITGWVTEWYHIVAGVGRMVLLGIPLSYCCGYVGSILMRASSDNLLILMLLTLGMCYGSYFLCSWIANAGLVGNIFTGVMMGMERRSLSSQQEKAITLYWRVLCCIMDGILFIFVGVVTPTVLHFYVTFKDYIMVLVTYLISNMGRLVCLLLFSPVLKKIGYGMNFNHLVICVWGGLKNPVALSLVLTLYSVYPKKSEEDKQIKVRLFYLNHFGLFMLLLIINSTFVPLLLRTLGMVELSIARQVNMNNCMKFIYEARTRAMTALKMDRFLSDANWPLVMASTALKHPYDEKRRKTNVNQNEEDEMFLLGLRFAACPECQTTIPYEPTAIELKEMTKEAKQRVLKLKKVLYWRQYENGIMSKEARRIMQEAVEVAMESDKFIIELDGLFKLFSKEARCYKCINNRLKFLMRTVDVTLKPPRKRWRLICWKIVNHIASKVFIYTVITLNFLLVGFYLIQNIFLQNRYTTHVILFYSSFPGFLIYLVEFWLKIFSYSWIYVCKHGFRTYFRSNLNIFEFVILCCAFAEVIFWTVSSLNSEKTQFQMDIFSYVFGALRMCRALSFFKFCYICAPVHLKLISKLNIKIDRYKALAYELGKNYISTEEDILENLDGIVKNEKIRTEIKQKIENDRLAISKSLGIAQKERPWIVTTVKTQLAARTVLNSMKHDIEKLKVEGWIDEIEYSKLLDSWLQRHHYLQKLDSIQPPTPKLIFRGVPYMADEEEVIDYLYANVGVKKYDPGDAVINEGEIADGIYVLVTGLMLISYVPKEAVLEKLYEVGALPVVDYLSSSKYKETVSEYLVPGNSIGELSLLTQRPYNSQVTAVTYSQVYILKRNVLLRAMEINPDPVNGLECRIWKTLGFKIALPVLMNSPSYHSYTQDRLKYVLERAFMPILKNYKIFVVNDMMQDIILIEGMVIDYNTRDVFTGPCYIPRSVQKFILPKSSLLNVDIDVETRLLIIPAKDFDEYEIMVNEENICEMFGDEPSKCLQHLMQEKKFSALKGGQRKKGILSFVNRRRQGYDGSKSRITFASSEVYQHKGPKM